MTAARTLEDIAIAVVIPATRDAMAQITRVLDQLPASGRLVVVFAAARLQQSLGALPELRDPRLILVTATQPVNAAAARNIGVMAAEGAQIFAFTDDDDAIAEDWLHQLTGPLVAGTADITGGTLVIDLRQSSYQIVKPAVDYWFRQALFGSNLALTADAWSRLKGFREEFGSCEDTDLAWRAGAAGLRISVAEAARVHFTRRDNSGEWRQRFRWGRASVGLLKSHAISLRHLPSLRDLVEDKTQSGFCTSPWGAAVAQWLGQSWQRLTVMVQFPRTPG